MPDAHFGRDVYVARYPQQERRLAVSLGIAITSAHSDGEWAASSSACQNARPHDTRPSDSLPCPMQ
jgi:hypothetical protein